MWVRSKCTLQNKITEFIELNKEINKERKLNQEEKACIP